jgi:membrane protease subunit (stomatin/prohibitin family)
MQQTSQSATAEQDGKRVVPQEVSDEDRSHVVLYGEGEQPCPQCGCAMSDLKGGRATICPNCGFKESCCY